MKQILSCCLLLFLLCTVFFSTVPAAATVIDSGTCGADARYVLDDRGNLTISGTGDIDASAFSYDLRIHRVLIEDGITAIGDFCFQECLNLSELTFPDNIRYIGIAAFDFCAITELVIPGSVDCIEVSAFSYTPLSNVVIPEGVTHIKECAFTGCSSLTSITLPRSLKVIDDHALSPCKALHHVLFTGTQAEWDTVQIAETNRALLHATVHTDCAGDEVVGGVCRLCGNDCIHEWDEGILAAAPTCAQAGQWRYTCIRCGYVRTDLLPQTDKHTYDTVSVVREPTCYREGEKVYTCTVCGKQLSSLIARTEHTPGLPATEYREQLCIVCGHVLHEKLTVKPKTTVPPVSSPALSKPAPEVSSASTADDTEAPTSVTTILIAVSVLSVTGICVCLILVKGSVGQKQ